VRADMNAEAVDAGLGVALSYEFGRNAGIVIVAGGRVLRHFWGPDIGPCRSAAEEFDSVITGEICVTGKVEFDMLFLLEGYFSGREVDPVDWPVDLRGLPEFNRAVYQAVRRLRRGRTASYGEIAAAVGSPGAARAVGNALARNPMPLFVPCHRVTAKNELGGWSGPAGWKEELLAREA
jgi:O-6-methylguanine DNA methyltransferase